MAPVMELVYMPVLEAVFCEFESRLGHHKFFARFVYRFRTLAFHVSKTGSIPVPCTSFAAKDVTGCQVASTVDMVTVFLRWFESNWLHQFL